MFQAKTPGGFGYPCRLIGLGSNGPTTTHGTESAGAGACIPENHESCSLLGITLHAIGALRVIADRFELEFFQKIRCKVVRVPLRNFSFEPTR